MIPPRMSLWGAPARVRYIKEKGSWFQHGTLYNELRDLLPNATCPPDRPVVCSRLLFILSGRRAATLLSGLGRWCSLGRKPGVGAWLPSMFLLTLTMVHQASSDASGCAFLSFSCLQVLDLGTNIGSFTLYALERECHVISFDMLQQNMLKVLQTLSRVVGPHGRLYLEKWHGFRNGVR
jgi:hypothetical protein